MRQTEKTRRQREHNKALFAKLQRMGAIQQVLIYIREISKSSRVSIYSELHEGSLERLYEEARALMSKYHISWDELGVSKEDFNTLYKDARDHMRYLAERHGYV